MKVRLTFKTPDVTDYAYEDLTEEQREEADKIVDKYVEYGEYVTIEFDTETGGATVVPLSNFRRP